MTATQRRWLPLLLVALLGVLATITSLGHDFTYDDRGIILQNARVHSLRHIPALFRETYWPLKFGADGYRPLVTTLFTVEWAASGGAPWLFHLVNLLLTVATCLAVYWCSVAVLPASAAVMASALFAVHPVHVEVTGNVVGQSELLVALCVALAVGIYLRGRQPGSLSAKHGVVILLLFSVALFSKEHAVVLPALLVAAELTVVSDSTWGARLKQTRPLFLALMAVALAFFYVRGLVVDNLAGFVPFPLFRALNMRALDRVGTMMNEIPRIAQLLLFPTHLSADYSPGDVLVANGLQVSQLPGFFICAAVVLLAVVLRRRAPVASFGLMWVMIAFLPVSNLLVPAGFVTAERTLFLPSMGLVFVAGAVVVWLREEGSTSMRRIGAGVFVLLLSLGLLRTLDRQRVWRNNDTFFAALMHDAPLGYRAHYIHAHHVGLQGNLREMEREYRRAIRIFPYDASMTLSIADAYARAGLYAPAADLFEWTYGVEPTIGDLRYEYVYSLSRLGRWRQVREQALLALALAPTGEIRLLRSAIASADTALRRRAK